MTATQYLLGVALIALWVGAPAVAAVLIRRRLLPGWRGAPAYLVDAVTTLALLLTTAQLLGTQGGLTRPGLTAGALVVTLSGALLSRRLPVLTTAAVLRPAEPWWSRLLGLLSVAAVLGVWGAKTRSVLEVGNFDSDTLVYHWPYAAVFAQSGWTTNIHLGAPLGGVSWHAANAELVGGISILAFQRDWLLPLLNLGWLALTLLAARVIGRRAGSSGPAVAVLCVLCVLPIMGRSQGGSGFTDMASLALLLAALALFLEAFDAGLSPLLLWSGAATGMAVSTKETALAVGLALAIAVLVLSRLRGFVLWAGPACLLGCFWYVRNLVREGNPLPTSHFGPFTSIAGPIIENHGYSVAHFLNNGDVVRHVLIPGLVDAWGVAWSVLVVGVLLAAGLGLRRGTPQDRALALIGLLGLASYLVTPTTAAGFTDRPVLFPHNTRYALPAVMVLVVLLVRLARPGRQRIVLGSVALLTLLATIASRGRFPTLLPHRGGDALMIAAASALVLLVLTVAGRQRWWCYPLLLVAALPALYGVGRDYERNRYAPTYGDPSRTFGWASTVHGAHIGLDGLSEEYPFVGNDVSNRVNYIGTRTGGRVFVEIPSCPQWREVVNASHFDYVVIGPHLNRTDLPAAAAWVDRAAMTPVLEAGLFTTYRLMGELDPKTC